MKKINIQFISGELNLEGILEMPGDYISGPGVVLCHPHPLYGGSMDNNVLHAVSKALVANGMAALRFNFRGVGRSEGAFAGGKGETDDALAAISFLGQRGCPGIGIMGYSFGGAVALTAGGKSGQVKAIGAVSPMDIPDPGDDSIPQLIICGAADTFIPSSEILKKREKMPGIGTVKVIDDADHFWWGFEENAAELLAEFFAENLF